MKTFHIDQLIKNPVNNTISKSYNNYDNVAEIEINQIDSGYDIKGIVNVFENTDTPHLLLNKDQEIVSYTCSCVFCDEVSPCAHIGALLLKLNELETPSFPFIYKSDKMKKIKIEEEQRYHKRILKQLDSKSRESRCLIQLGEAKYKSEINSFLTKEKYKLIPQFTYNQNTPVVSYKIGNQKTYILKNISDFLSRIDDKEYFTYGKSLAFTHSENAFDEFTNKQIDFLRKANNYFNQESLTSYDYAPDDIRKELYLKNEFFDDFYELYQNEMYPSFHMEEHEDQIKLELQKFDEFYTLQFLDHNPLLPGNHHLYSIEENKKHYTIKRYRLDNQGKAMELLYALNKEPLIIVKKEYPDFYKYVLSPLTSYLDIKDIDTVQENNYELIRIYGDVNADSQIFFKVYYVDEKNDKITAFKDDFIKNYNQDLVEQYIKTYSSSIDYEKGIAYFDPNDEETYTFLNEGVDFLNEYAELYVSDALKKFGKKANYSITVGVRLTNDLLALDIESLQIPKNELSQVLEQYHKKKKFHRLKNGELLYLDSPQLEELDQMIEQYHIPTKDIKDGQIQLSQNRMFSIDENADQYEFIEFDRKNSFKKQIDKFNTIDNQTYELPKSYDTILRDYQKDGFTWLRTLKDYGFNGILADDMGLGKTLQVITLLESIQTKLPSLVVCPASLIYNWNEEINKFSKNLKTICVVGNQSERKEIIDNAKNYDLLITSYDYIRRDVDLFENTVFEYLILDEAQYIKNQKTKNARSVKMLTANHKLALTGTPIENSLAELWSIFDFLMPQYLFNYRYFQTHYENDIVKNNDSEKTKQLKNLVSPFILRRNKKDVLLELPDKIEKTQIIPFNEEEEKLYLANLAQVNQELQDVLNMEKVDKIVILAMLTRLRQICCEPRLVYDNINNSSSKMKACLDLVSTFKANNQKVLIFSSFTSVLDLMSEELSLLGIKYCVLTGSVSKEKRRDLVEQFQNGDYDVFLISLKAGGTGLNLTRAEAVIHFDPWWNMSAQNQATDRAHRIGQTKNLQVFKLVMKDSIEEKIVSLQEKKKELADLFVENNEGSIGKMSKEEIMDLFSL